MYARSHVLLPKMVHVHMRMRACGNQANVGYLLQSLSTLLVFVCWGEGRQGLLLNVALTHLARLESQQAPETLPSLPPQC